MKILVAILQLAGAGLLITGVGLVSIPAATIVAGLILLGLGVAAEIGSG